MIRRPLTSECRSDFAIDLGLIHLVPRSYATETLTFLGHQPGLAAASMHHSSSSSLLSGSAGLPTLEGQSLEQQQRPHQLPLHSSKPDINGVALTKEVKTWNPFEDSFTQISEDHLFGQEFDKIRQQGSQTSE